MFFQGRGNTYLQERSASAITGAAVLVCQDSFSVALATDSFEHLNKCGPVDTPDFRGSKGSTGTVTLSYADVEDKKFAIGVLGTVVAAQSPGTVTDEELPTGLVAGDVYFAGGLVRHRAHLSERCKRRSLCRCPKRKQEKDEDTKWHENFHTITRCYQKEPSRQVASSGATRRSFHVLFPTAFGQCERTQAKQDP